MATLAITLWRDAALQDVNGPVPIWARALAHGLLSFLTISYLTVATMNAVVQIVEHSFSN